MNLNFCRCSNAKCNLIYPILLFLSYSGPAICRRKILAGIVDWKLWGKGFEMGWEIHFSLLALIWRINVHDFSCWIWKSSKQKTIPNSLNIPNFLVPRGKQFDANFKREGNFWGFSHLKIHSGEKSSKSCLQGETIWCKF